MKGTPDKIKKALEFGKDNCLFVNGDCKDCAYEKECSTYDCDSMADLPRAMISDALAYIQQLEARNNAMYNTILSVMHFVDKWLDCPGYDPDADLNGVDAVQRAVKAREIALQAIEQLEAERDQAVEDLRYIGKLRENNCTFCLYYNHGDGSKECIRCGMFGEDHWQWRGVPEREG